MDYRQLIQNYAHLTNQREDTIIFMNLTQYADIQNLPNFVKTIDGVNWCSRFFDYRLKMLENLAPNNPNVAMPPFNNLPPPHLLIGYAYIFNVNNNYLFDERVYPLISYSTARNEMNRPRNFWSTLISCSYEINTENYDFNLAANFQENFLTIQHAILNNRIRADMQATHILRLRGEGLKAISLQPEAVESFRAQFELNSRQNKDLAHFENAVSREMRFRYETQKDAAVLNEIEKLYIALSNFLYLWYKGSEQILSLPCDYDWLNSFVAKFHTMSPPYNENEHFIFLQCHTLSKNAGLVPISTWSSAVKNLIGGANLRSGTKTGLPMELRQRENQRAITEQMRRNRGQLVRRFIDSLPLIRRRPRARDVEEEEEPMSPGEGPSGIAQEDEEEPEEEERTLGEEIVSSVAEAIRLLRLELSERAQEHEIFSFSQRMYEILIEAERNNRLTVTFLRRFSFYFFILEHITSTLFYYHVMLTLNVAFRRFVQIDFVQVILSGRNENGEQILHRNWHNNNISPFIQIYRTILENVIHMCERADTEYIEPEDQADLLSSIGHRAASGNPDDIINQARLNENEVQHVTITVRIKPRGLVALSKKRVIIANAQQERTAELRRIRGRPRVVRPLN
ncbi:pTP [Frog adenovirus 1]|uniref:PTP n=1 Tax=Frog adenovirus 1 (strain ATCC VR-896) TaxID=114102 RepID=Q9III2_ADEF1|nr:pTP [Frog adenovirus 1]AAF86925.1 pTP [Frog adenovirus 1]